jgi:hypothetical protein
MPSGGVEFFNFHGRACLAVLGIPRASEFRIARRRIRLPEPMDRPQAR